MDSAPNSSRAAPMSIDSATEDDDDNNNNNNNNEDSDGRLTGASSNSADQSQSPSIAMFGADLDSAEHLRSLLNRKRLSEGQCGVSSASLQSGSALLAGQASTSARLASAYCLARKNSLHLDPETSQRMPPLTEGKPMQHMRSSNNNTTTNSKSNLDSAFGSDGSNLANNNNNSSNNNQVIKRNYSQDDIAVSSSTSLERSPTNTNSSSSASRRRSSTISQCSSVLSESARQQLNFDLSPDLPADSSLMEANALDDSSIDVVCCFGELDERARDFADRPQSPEPLCDADLMSPFSRSGSASNATTGTSSFELNGMRPISRMSQCLDELMLVDQGSFESPPDSTLGDSNSNSNSNSNSMEPAREDSAVALDGRLAALTQPAAAVLANRHNKQARSSETASSNQATSSTGIKRAHTPCVAAAAQHSRSNSHKGSHGRRNVSSQPINGHQPSARSPDARHRCVSSASARSSPNCGAQLVSGQLVVDGSRASPAPTNGSGASGEIATH